MEAEYRVVEWSETEIVTLNSDCEQWLWIVISSTESHRTVTATEPNLSAPVSDDEGDRASGADGVEGAAKLMKLKPTEF